MVVIRRPSTSAARRRQEHTGSPSTRTVQAPHAPRPQTTLVPVRPSLSRRASASTTRGSTVRRCVRPLMSRVRGTAPGPRARSGSRAGFAPAFAATAPTRAPRTRSRRVNPGLRSSPIGHLLAESDHPPGGPENGSSVRCPPGSPRRLVLLRRVHVRDDSWILDGKLGDRVGARAPELSQPIPPRKGEDVAAQLSSDESRVPPPPLRAGDPDASGVRGGYERGDRRGLDRWVIRGPDEKGGNRRLGGESCQTEPDRFHHLAVRIRIDDDPRARPPDPARRLRAVGPENHDGPDA